MHTFIFVILFWNGLYILSAQLVSFSLPNAKHLNHERGDQQPPASFWLSRYSRWRVRAGLQVVNTAWRAWGWTAVKSAGAWFNIKIPSYQYKKYQCGDKTILRPSYLHNGISYTDKMASYRISGQMPKYFGFTVSKQSIRLGWFNTKTVFPDIGFTL